jgi:hypothetical protein
MAGHDEEERAANDPRKARDKTQANNDRDRHSSHEEFQAQVREKDAPIYVG